LNYNKKITWLIVISTLVRILFASATELGNTEAYYWVLANKLQWNYFDHPPMVAWLIRLTTANLLLHSELFVRLGAIIAASICTWLMFKLGTLIHSERAGWFAAFLYTTCIYTSIGIGIYILPDSPQMIFWLASLISVIKVFDKGLEGNHLKVWWIALGILNGLCIMSKVHGVFIWSGIIAYILLFDRSHLRNPFLYIAMSISLLIIYPIIDWNIQNHFISYRFHSQRVNLSNGSFSLIRFGKSLGEVLFSFGPFHYVLIILGVIRALKGRLTISGELVKLLLLCHLPLVFILLGVSFFRETLSHWPGPALCGLLIFPAIWLAESPLAKYNELPGVLKTALGYTAVIAIVGTFVINFYPGTTSSQQTGMKTGVNDATIDMYGWKKAAHIFDSVYRNDVAKKIIRPGASLVVTHWIPAAHIDYYIAANTGQSTYALGGIDSLHQYYFTNKFKKALQPGDDAYYLIPSNLFDYSTFDKVANSFNSFTIDLIYSQYRSSVECKKFYIFRLKSFKGDQYFK